MRGIWPLEVGAEISTQDYNCTDGEGPTQTWKILLTKRLTLASNLIQFKLLPNQEGCLEAKLGFYANKET